MIYLIFIFFLIIDLIKRLITQTLAKKCTHLINVDKTVFKAPADKNVLFPTSVFHIQRLWCKYRDKVVMRPRFTDNVFDDFADGCVPSGNTTVLNSLGICSYLKTS